MGKYVDQNLSTGEKVIYEARLHWIMYANAFLVVFVGLLLLYIGIIMEGEEASDSLKIAGYFVIACGVVSELYMYLFLKTAEFAVTTKRIISKRGIISTKTIELLLSKAEAISVDQNVLGKIFAFGSIRITGSGGTNNVIPFIADPFKFRKIAQEEIEKAQKK